MRRRMQVQFTKRLMHARHYIYWPVGILKLFMDKGFCWLVRAPPSTIQEYRVAEIYDSAYLRGG
jgi:hypothetical protein